jgi:amidohydrolase
VLISEIDNILDKAKELVLEAERHIWKSPETGYKEWQTSKYMQDIFKSLGYDINPAGDIPGFSAEFDTGRSGPCIAIMAEMDALNIPEHPNALKSTGAVHACGHNAQCAAIVGTAAAMRKLGNLSDLCGKVRFIIVPAEEMIEIGFRKELIAKGIIKYYSGKPEFMRRGFFDNVDMAFMGHASSKPQKYSVEVYPGNNGCMYKTSIYSGHSAHGSNPQKGVNALNSAILGLQAINSIRETFIDGKYIRVNPIINNIDNAANAIPDNSKIELMLRAKDIECLTEINRRLNMALASGACAIGSTLTIEDILAYYPLTNSMELNHIISECGAEISNIKDVINNPEWDTGSTDVGSLSAVMPVCHFYVGGSSGGTHTIDFHVSHPEVLCLNTAKIYTLALFKLMSNNGALADKVMTSYKPKFSSIKSFLNYTDRLNRVINSIKYNALSCIEIKI